MGFDYSVSQLTQEIREFLGEAFPGVWVVGEAQRVYTSRNGHLYFELVEKGRRDEIIGKLDCVVWRRDLERLRRLLARSGQELGEGQQIRCGGQIDFYGAGGRLQLIVRELDPLFSLGKLEQRRRQTLEALKKTGLLDRNPQLVLSAVPLRIGLVTSSGSAAYHDFLSSLEGSGFGFRLLLVHAAMQGREAEREVASALRLLSEPEVGRELDAVVLIRGGGARSDLAVFDSRSIAEAVARCPLPVLTGLGHETDRSIADQVSHTALKTPTMVAEFLSGRVYRAELKVSRCGEAIGRLAHRALEHSEQRLRRCEALVPSARLRLLSAARDLEELGSGLRQAGRRGLESGHRKLTELARALARAAPRQLDHHRGRPEQAVRRLADLARGRLGRVTAEVDGMARVVSQLGPDRVLSRGFSITRDSLGRIVRDPEALRAGDTLSTQLAGGEVKSRVEDPERVQEPVS